MPVDTRGLRPEHVGKRLRVELAGGEVEEVNLLELTVCPEPEPCCGITYRLLSTNQTGNGKEQGSTYWTAFSKIENFRVLGD